jgi:hypothetical protein
MDEKTANEIMSDVGSLVESALIGRQAKMSDIHGKFTDTSLTLTIRVNCLSPDGSDADERKNWDLYCANYGLAPTDYLRLVTVEGREMRLTGIVPKRVKHPFTATQLSTGKRWRWSQEAVLKAIRNSPKI